MFKGSLKRDLLKGSLRLFKRIVEWLVQGIVKALFKERNFFLMIEIPLKGPLRKDRIHLKR